MSQTVTHLLAECHPVQDLETTDLGDKRLNDRHRAILENMTLAPSASNPETFDDDNDLEAYYRFTDNERFDHDDLLEPHFQASAARAKALGEVLVLHDTTRISFPVHDDHERQNLSRFSAHTQGFEWHASLLLAPNTLRAPLGLIASRPFVHTGDVEGDTEQWWRERGGLYDNEMSRWLESVEAAEARLQDVQRVTHVMDREGDCFELLFCLEVSGYDFLIRASHDRLLSTGPRRVDFEKLDEALQRAEWLGESTIELSARSASRASPQHPARRARTAEVKVRAVEVEVRRPDNVSSDLGTHAKVRAWAVEMVEQNPPEGEPAARWVLLTSWPVQNEEQAWKMVSMYQARWTIEELNKALKTGCALSKVQQRSASSLLKALALAAPVAWYLLVLRHLGEHAEQLEARQIISELELELLRAKRPKLVGRRPTARDVMRAIASLGGHIKRNGRPGWLVLERGRRKLAEMVAGAQVFMRLSGTYAES